MNIVTSLVLILCGIFAAAGIAARLQADRGRAVDELAWWQGCVGLPTAAWGVWVLVLSVVRLYQLKSNPVWWGTFLGTGAFEIVLGLLLGVALLSRGAGRNGPRADAAGSRVRQGLSLVSIPLGLLAIAAGFWCFAAAFLFHEF